MNTKIKWGFAGTLQVSGIRIVLVRLSNSTKIVVLEKYLYVPELKINLVLISRHIQNGATVSFSSNYYHLKLLNSAKISTM